MLGETKCFNVCPHPPVPPLVENIIMFVGVSSQMYAHICGWVVGGLAPAAAPAAPLLCHLCQ